MVWRQDAEQLNQKIRNIKETNFVICLEESVKVCVELLVKRKRVIREYKKNMDLYTDKNAWIKYLKR